MGRQESFQYGSNEFGAQTVQMKRLKKNEQGKQDYIIPLMISEYITNWEGLIISIGE